MNKKFLCRLSLSEHGLNDGDFWIEARPLSKGFSVCYFVPDLMGRPKRLFSTKRAFSVHQFATYLREQPAIYFDDIETWEEVSVDGALGLDAAILKLALLGDYSIGDSLTLSKWLSRQNQRSREFIEAHIPLRTAGDVVWLSEMLEHAEFVMPGVQITELLDRYQLPHKATSLKALNDLVVEDSEEIQAKHAESIQADIAAKLLPFKDEIEQIANNYDDQTSRVGAGISGGKPSKRTFITRWLNDFVVKHHRLPEGAHHVECPFLSGKISLGIIDFTALKS